VAYDGSGYQGFQRLEAAKPSITGALESALTAINGGLPVEVLGAGRTDAGVHATGQVIAFDLQWRHTEDELVRALNVRLPMDIAVQQLERVEADFHPRYDALSRRYEYRVYAAPVRQPVLDHTQWYIGPGAPALDAMNTAAALLIGPHDFASFGSPPMGERGTTLREVYRSEWTTAGTMFGALLYSYTIEANAFLYRMVRAIVSSLIEVGKGHMSIAAFANAFLARQRSAIKHLAPPHGLTLVEVTYQREQTPAGA